jgi:F-type H+-transporting ATPase subunit delta
MKISKEARKVSRELFQASFSEGRLNPESVRMIFAKVAASKPRHYMDILKNYQRLIRLSVEKRHAVVESAAPLESGVADQISKTLLSNFGSDLTTEFKLTPNLIGGLRIKLGSTVWDSSVRGRLDRFEAQIAQV